MNAKLVVYTVERCYDYEGCSLEGVFSTQELADAYVEKRKSEGYSADFEVAEMIVDKLLNYCAKCGDRKEILVLRPDGRAVSPAQYEPCPVCASPVRKGR